jgi:biotin carboxylase
MSTTETVGDRVKQVLQTRGMKQIKLAELLGIEPSSLSNALSRSYHSWDRWVDVAKILEVPHLWLMSGSNNQPWEATDTPVVSALPADHPYGQRVAIVGSGYIAVELAQDKEETNKILANCGLPVPRQELVRSADRAVRAAERLGGPVVTKPYNGNHGRGISIGLKTPEEVRANPEVQRVYLGTSGLRAALRARATAHG